jgi:hypothetical protein
MTTNSAPGTSSRHELVTRADLEGRLAALLASTHYDTIEEFDRANDADELCDHDHETACSIRSVRSVLSRS